MNRQKTFFVISTLSALITPSTLPIPLLVYAPYLMSILIMNRSLKTVLWHSILCGIIVDLLQSALPFGYSSLCYSLIVLILYKQKRWIFNDKLGSLTLFVSIFSLLFSFLQLTILSIQGRPLTLSWSALLSDLLLMPLYDGFYAFICFTSPFLIYEQIKKWGFRFLFIRKLN